MDKECWYCDKCKGYYFGKPWDISTEEMRTICINPLEGGYLDRYQYKQVRYKVWYRTCPNGHKIEVEKVKIKIRPKDE